ncbi:hypothetical protein SAMN05216344_104181 [Polaromonas sp. OV174]|uniref:hypothetical protein n=1 Tax=Polaromonas sp. OV174 TaxID=1855300 RepID=UPI0008E0586E|nr:hypothetical protein [Polaromonas sp. OV174]SFB86012.1 hypothetical protein SAMN05216344_104181 [Polaromonas sp. OV174]
MLLTESVDLACQDLELYQYKTCPFCIKVRQEVRRLSLNIPRIDTQAEGRDRAELLQQSLALRFGKNQGLSARSFCEGVIAKGAP